MGNIRHQRVVWVGVSEQRADGQQYLANGECRTPLVLEDVQTDGSIGVDIGMVNAGRELALGGLERVVIGESDVEEENAALVRTVIRSHDSGSPVELVLVVCRPSTAIGRGVALQVRQFL